MKLYYAPGTCALSCWIALRWAKADFEVEKVDYASAEFKRINPLAQVPALYLGGDRAHTQVHAILDYIAETHPQAELGADDDAVSRLEFAEAMSFLTGDFHPAVWPMFSPQRFTTDTSPAAREAVVKASYPRIDRVMTHLDTLIGDSGHVYRDKRTVADAYAYIMARWSVKTPKSWKEYPGLVRLFDWMDQDADAQEVLRASNA